MDNLKAVLVAWVIGGHALLGYSAVGGWPYDEVHEVTFSRPVELALTVLIGPTGLFMMGTFFFVAGLFMARSLARRDAGTFARERLVRLGWPFAVSALVIWPLTMWLAYRAAGHDVSVGWILTHREPLLDSGSLWFVEVLLLFSLACAVARTVIVRPGPVTPLTGWHLVATAAGIAVVTYVVRLWFPARSGQVGDLHIWQWPQLAGMFVLGIEAGRRGWARQVPDRLWRRCAWTMVAVAGLLPVFAVVASRLDLRTSSGVFLGGEHWQSLLAAVLEGTVVVAGSVWLLGLAQRRLTGTGPLWTWAARMAFAAFVVQGPVLIAVATALRPLAAPAEIKALAVLVCGIVGSYGVGSLLVTHTRLGRFL